MTLTEILQRLREGEPEAESELLEVAYRELRAIAQGQLSKQRKGHTLRPTDLVHQGYLKLFAKQSPAFEDSAHFRRTAALAMRQILIDHARARKRRGGDHAVLYESGIADALDAPIDALELEEALEQLHDLCPRQAEVVTCRFFGGLTVKELAGVLGVSSRTVETDWRMARAFLYGKLKEGLE